MDSEIQNMSAEKPFNTFDLLGPKKLSRKKNYLSTLRDNNLNEKEETLPLVLGHQTTKANRYHSINNKISLNKANKE